MKPKQSNNIRKNNTRGKSNKDISFPWANLIELSSNVSLPRSFPLCSHWPSTLSHNFLSIALVTLYSNCFSCLPFTTECQILTNRGYFLWLWDTQDAQVNFLEWLDSYDIWYSGLCFSNSNMIGINCKLNEINFCIYQLISFRELPSTLQTS